MVGERIGISRRGKFEPVGVPARATMGMKMGGIFEGGTPGGMRMVGERIGISRRGKFEPGTKIRQKAANFEPGTDLRRTRGSGFSRVARICGGHTARDFDGGVGRLKPAPLAPFAAY